MVYAFNSDGTKMYIIGSSANRIIQFTLSTPFDISEATLLTGSICTEGFAGDGLKIIFNSDGSKFFLVDRYSGCGNINFKLLTIFQLVVIPVVKILALPI